MEFLNAFLELHIALEMQEVAAFLLCPFVHPVVLYLLASPLTSSSFKPTYLSLARIRMSKLQLLKFLAVNLPLTQWCSVYSYYVNFRYSFHSMTGLMMVPSRSQWVLSWLRTRKSKSQR